jgi:phosphoribosylformylglycinamidine synthase
MSSKGEVGMEIDLDLVPMRESDMTGYELMLSESQERMLAIVTPADLERVLAVCHKWDVDASVIGTVTGSGRLRILDGPGGAVLADLPAASIEDDKPRYDRPRRRPADQDALQARDASTLPRPDDCGAALLDLLVDPAWVYRQYDHQLFLNTVEPPGGDAAVLRLKAPGIPVSRRGLAVSTDGNARWCAVDPRHGTAMVVAESALNVACSGARPVALVNCLNYGNPEHPEVMWQLSESIDGMAEACRVLDLPVIGGNVSLYNETRGRDIDPTPVVAVLGLIETLDRRPPGVRFVDGDRLLLLGETQPTLAGSLWALKAHGFKGGRLPDLDLVAHVDLLQLVAALVRDGLVDGVHDVSEGGLAVALGEMAVRSGVGCSVFGVAGHAGLFSESPSRVVLCVAPDRADEVVQRATAAGVPVSELGEAGGDRIVVQGLVNVSVADAVTAATTAIPSALHPELVDR